MNPDPATVFSSLTFKTPTKNYFLKSFSAYYFLKVHLHHFSKVKSQNEVTKRWKSSFSYFCLMIEGFGPGSIPLTIGSGYRRPKNIRIRRIRIRNTELQIRYLFIRRHFSIYHAHHHFTKTAVSSSVGDSDPHVFGPLGSGPLVRGTDLDSDPDSSLFS
jgi:hypothetical protein